MNQVYGYNLTIGGDGRVLYRTEEEKQKARQMTVERSLEKLNADPVRKEKDVARRRAYANNKYAELKNKPEQYEIIKAEARARAAKRQADPVAHQKILASRKRCKQKAMQDPDKKAKILEANRNAKQAVKAIRESLFELYESYPEAFTVEDAEIAFTKFSPESGCFKYNSAKRLQQILNEVTMKVGVSQ